MGADTSLSWVFPTEKMWFVVNRFLPVFEDPMILIMGLAILVGLATVVSVGATALREPMRPPSMINLDGLRESPPDIGKSISRPANIAPSWSPLGEQEGYQPARPFRSRKGYVTPAGRTVVGQNQYQDNPFKPGGHPPGSTFVGRAWRGMVEGLEDGIWNFISGFAPPENTLRGWLFGGAFSEDGLLGDLFFPKNRVRAKDYDDPVEYLKAKGVFNPGSYINGVYITPEAVYKSALAKLSANERSVFLSVKPHLNQYYKGKLTDYELLEIYTQRIKDVDRDLPLEDEDDA